MTSSKNNPTKDQSDSKIKTEFPAPTVSQLEEALEERTKSDRRVNQSSTDIEADRRVADRRNSSDSESVN